MGKVFKVVLLIAVAVAIIVFATPLAGFLGPVASGGIGVLSAAGVATAASALVGIGISLALSAVATLFRKAPSLSNSLADRLNAQVAPVAPRKIVFGKTAGGNDIRFFETYGNDKDRYAQVIALASHKLNAITSIYVEDDLTWSNGSIVAHQDGFESIRVVTEGTTSNGAPVGTGTYWKSTATFTGCAYMALTWKLSNDAWPQGLSTRITTLVEGCPVYDPRLDSTTGGNGPHRVGNQATWAYRNGSVEIGRNPALCLLTYMIGYRLNGKLLWGMGIPASRFDFDNFRTYANVCEEQVATAGAAQSGGGGGSGVGGGGVGGGGQQADGLPVQRYTCDGIFSTSDTHESVISAITAAMGSCKLSDVGGLYGLIGGYDDTLGPKQAFTADDLVGGVGSPTPFNWTPAGPARDTYNIVRGRFADPDQQFQLAEWGVVETDNLPDGVPRQLSLDLGCVSRAETCQRIAKQFLLREALTPGFFTATFGPRAFAVQVGSLVTLSLPAQGWNNKLFRVQSQTEVHDMFFQMTLREESSAVYAWDREEKPLPSTIRPSGYDASATILPQNMSLETHVYQAAD